MGEAPETLGNRGPCWGKWRGPLMSQQHFPSIIIIIIIFLHYGIKFVSYRSIYVMKHIIDTHL